MKKNICKMLMRIYSIIFSLMISSGCSIAYGQIPQDTPHPNDNKPMRLDNWTNIIFFVILPILFVTLYLWLKRKRKNDNNQ